MEEILKQFPNLTDNQIQQFEKLQLLYEDWNSKINVISRKDIDELYTRHVLHSLGIAKIIEFKSGSKIMDVGTGGGFPAIPLAILFHEFDFIVSRAVTNMPDFVSWIKDKIKSNSKHELQNGILYLKGGDLSEELKDFPKATEYNLADYFSEEFYETKKVVHLPLKTK